MKFVWDPEKEKQNIKKHGIDFDMASHVFSDEHCVVIFDDEHSDDEERYLAIGMVNEVMCIVTVVFTHRDTKAEEIVRLISARVATAKERRKYYVG